MEGGLKEVEEFFLFLCGDGGVCWGDGGLDFLTLLLAVFFLLLFL